MTFDRFEMMSAAKHTVPNAQALARLRATLIGADFRAEGAKKGLVFRASPDLCRQIVRWNLRTIYVVRTRRSASVHLPKWVLDNPVSAANTAPLQQRPVAAFDDVTRPENVVTERAPRAHVLKGVQGCKMLCANAGAHSRITDQQSLAGADDQRPKSKDRLGPGPVQWLVSRQPHGRLRSSRDKPASNRPRPRRHRSRSRWLELYPPAGHQTGQHTRHRATLVPMSDQRRSR